MPAVSVSDRRAASGICRSAKTCIDLHRRRLLIGHRDSQLQRPNDRMLPGASSPARVSMNRDLARLVAMMGLFFLVVCAVGILRPIKNALALDGLGATDFYKVYLVSAVVILFVPLYNRVSDRLSWRWLIPAVSLFFALQLVLLRTFYVEGSTVFGLVFYGWYDLFASALVTQFFMATQLFVDARLARRAYPVVIAGGALGATLGGAITALLAVRIGTPNLMLVAAGLIVVFSVAMPIIWRDPAVASKRRLLQPAPKLHVNELRRLLANRHVRLIAGMVLLMIVIKQLVDYQFNTLSKEIFQERDAISAFQGRFNAATQWLPLVAVVVLQPLLRRWGVALAVLLLPAAMLLTNAGLFLFWGLGMAVAAKAAETSLRYSAERAGREILYVPVPDEIKLRAKTYIDVAIEKGAGKLISAGAIFLLLAVMSYRTIALVSVALSVLWLVMALRVKREYVRSLAQSLDGGFASLSGIFASFADATSAPVVRRALAGDEAQIAFTLDLVAQGRPQETAPLAEELHALLEHPAAHIRTRALAVLARAGLLEPDRVRLRLLDDDSGVREAAVRALHEAGGTAGLIEELLASEHARVRTAVLACLARDEIGSGTLDAARRAYAGRWPKNGASDSAGRLEMALAVGALRMGDDGAALVEPLLDDSDPHVASTALRSVARTGSVHVYPRLIAALGRPGTREAARDALAEQGARIVPAMVSVLLDPHADRAVRRSVPDVLARIATPASVDALVRGALAAETDQLLDGRAVRALSRLRAHHPELTFDAGLVRTFIQREATVARSLLEVEAALQRTALRDATTELLRRALREAGEDRRENVFRCLGLLHDAAAMHRCWYAIARGDARAAANAVEWLEHTVDRDLFQRITPVIGDGAGLARRRDPIRLLGGLAAGDDVWLACCARRVAAVLFGTGTTNSDRSTAMDLVDKVFLLQRLELLRDAQSAHLALLAAIADEIDTESGEVLVRRGEAAAALFIVVAGTVEMRDPARSRQIHAGGAFGSSALIDDEPALADVVAIGRCRLLRIQRDEFRDLLSDHPELAITLLRGVGRHMRALGVSADSASIPAEALLPE